MNFRPRRRLTVSYRFSSCRRRKRVGSVPPERGGKQCLIQNASCCHKFVGSCRPSVHECWISISARLYSALRIISAAIVVVAFFLSFFLLSLFLAVDFLANFNNRITKISRIYAHQKKKKNRISKYFPISLSKNVEISPEK